MNKIVQEKFLVDNPQNPNDDAQGGWVSAKSARTKRGLQTRGGDGRYEPYTGDMYNSLPPGMDVADQEVSYQPSMSWAGCLGSGTQVTEDVTAKSLKAGFDRKKLNGTDDMYTREHNDAFYDEVTVDGETGYLERNNVLDRM